MNESDTAQLLARVQSFDRRTIGVADVAAWHQIIGDLDLQDCVAAVVEHYRQPSPPWCMPSHVRTAVLAKRPGPNDRDVRAALGPATPGDYTTGVQTVRQAITAARTSMPVDTPEQAARRQVVMAVACPWCHAQPKQPCTVPAIGAPLTGRMAHPARETAAGIA